MRSARKTREKMHQAHLTHLTAHSTSRLMADGVSTMAHPLTAETTAGSLKTALHSNLQLQAEVVRRLQNLAKRKAENRRLASRIQAQIVHTWDEIDVLRTPPPPVEPKVRAKKRKENEVGATGSAEKYTTKWNYDPFRSKWSRRFFVDPDGSCPAPNEDIIKRRRLEEGKFFYHTCPPWPNKEVEALLSITTEMLAKNKDNDNAQVDSCLDFAQVARTLEERTKNADKAKCPTARPRSADDCRLKYTETRRKNPAFTKEESMRILEQVHLHNGKPQWQDVATSLNRTAWQCLLAYQTKLTSSRSLPWTRLEDEVLLKYVAAMGPQWLLTLGSAADLSAQVLPNRSPKQVLARANTTLVNPNFVRDVWSDEEERKLVLCMKVYRDTPNPIMRAAAHFPNRATKSVSEKWDRSLNPEYSTNPFTASEDRTLLEAVRQSPDAGWAEISRLFPSRHARTLANRWNELASPEDLLRKYGNVMKQEGARRGVVGSEGLLSSDDFVVRAKQEPDGE